MPVPPREAAEALSRPHQVVARAEVDTGTAVVPVDVVRGTGRVSLDRGRVWRREASVTVSRDTDPALLQMRGHRLRLWRGLVLPSGEVAQVPIFTGRITGAARDGLLGGWQVSAKGLEYEVERARFLSPRDLSGSSAHALIRQLLREVVAGATLRVEGARDAQVPPVVHEQDRWKAIDGADESLARALGAHVYADAWGEFVLAPLPAVDDPVVWDVSEGALLSGWRESVTEDGVHNIVVAYGERVDGTGPLPWGLWWDRNRYSPTFVGDLTDQLMRGAGSLTAASLAIEEAGMAPVRGFGPSPRFYASPVLTDNGQAAAAAHALGRAEQGVMRQVQFECPVNPWLDLEVVTGVVDGHPERHLLESLDIPLDDGVMSGTSRQAVTR